MNLDDTFLFSVFWREDGEKQHDSAVFSDIAPRDTFMIFHASFSHAVHIWSSKEKKQRLNRNLSIRSTHIPDNLLISILSNLNSTNLTTDNPDPHTCQVPTQKKKQGQVTP